MQFQLASFWYLAKSQILNANHFVFVCIFFNYNECILEQNQEKLNFFCWIWTSDFSYNIFVDALLSWYVLFCMFQSQLPEHFQSIKLSVWHTVWIIVDQIERFKNYEKIFPIFFLFHWNVLWNIEHFFVSFKSIIMF